MWKNNWKTTRKHFVDWWDHKGLILGAGKPPEREGTPHADIQAPAPLTAVADFYMEYDLRAQRNHHDLAHKSFPADVLPISDTNLGPGSLALFLGAELRFSTQTLWFEPCLHKILEPETLPTFKFDQSNRWWQLTEATLKACAGLAQDCYLVGCPDLVENIDILAALREPQMLLMDMIERPEWVKQKVAEINRVWFEAYQCIYDIIRLDDGSSAFGAFRLWGPGKTAKVQCDASAMFSPDMFRLFVMPALREQCRWLDHSMYHLDGTQALVHLDALLEIAELDAVEWTPQAGIPGGGNPRWYDLYRRILDAGKSVQVVGVRQDEIIPLLDAIGGQGVYLMTSFTSSREAGEMMKRVDAYR